MTVTNDEWVKDDAAETADEALESAGMAAEAVVATAEDELVDVYKRQPIGCASASPGPTR